MSNRNATVDAFMDELAHPRKDDVARLRTLILAADPRITETVKWKAPTFGMNGTDRVTFQLRAKRGIQLILHRGAKKNASAFTFEDPLLTWLDSDRATIIVEDPAQYEAVANVVHRWILATSADI